VESTTQRRPPTTQTARRKKKKTIRPDGRHTTIGRKTRSTIAGSTNNPDQTATQGRREIDPLPQQKRASRGRFNLASFIRPKSNKDGKINPPANPEVHKPPKSSVGEDAGNALFAGKRQKPPSGSTVAATTPGHRSSVIDLDNEQNLDLNTNSNSNF